MTKEHERVARELVERWDVERGAPGKFPSLSKLIAAALAAASARADEAGWRRGHAEALFDYQPSWAELVPRDYAPPKEDAKRA